MYYRNRSMKTSAALDWSHTVLHHLGFEENAVILEELRDHFDPEQHMYAIDLEFYYPKELLITKKRTLSSKAHDLSNIEKPLIDLIFLPTYFNKPSPYGAKNLNIDDKFISDLSSKKRPSDEHRIIVNITINDLNQILPSLQSETEQDDTI